jgi:hypothetical protein
MAAPERHHGDSLGPLIRPDGECDLCGDETDDLTECGDDGWLCPTCKEKAE